MLVPGVDDSIQIFSSRGTIDHILDETALEINKLSDPYSVANYLTSVKHEHSEALAVLYKLFLQPRL